MLKNTETGKGTEMTKRMRRRKLTDDELAVAFETALRAIRAGQSWLKTDHEIANAMAGWFSGLVQQNEAQALIEEYELQLDGHLR